MEVVTGSKAELVLVKQPLWSCKFNSGNSLETGGCFRPIRWWEIGRRKWMGRIYIGLKKGILEYK